MTSFPDLTFNSKDLPLSAEVICSLMIQGITSNELSASDVIGFQNVIKYLDKII